MIDRSVLERSYAAHLAALQHGYEQVMAAGGWDAIVLLSGRGQAVNPFDDRHHPLSPTPAFLHWAPLWEADAAVVVRPGKRPELVRTRVDDYWHAATELESDHFLAGFDQRTVADAASWSELPAGKVGVVTREGSAPWGEVNPPALIAALDQLRTRKTEYERLCLTEATRRGVRGHRRAREMFLAGDRSELQLHLGFLEASEQDETASPYQNIVAQGRHAATLHHVVYARQAPGTPHQSLLVDAGARCLGYGSDITRTWTRGRTGLFAELVAKVDGLQQQLCAEVAPGLEYEALHDRMHQLLAAALVDLGIAGGAGRGSAEAVLAAGVTRAFLPHGLGHSLGLIVHDVGMRQRPPRPENHHLRTTATIEVGQVFTIEPGCYVIDSLMAKLRASEGGKLVDWNAVEAVAPFGGVRIEDNVVVMAGGVQNLTREAFAAA